MTNNDANGGNDSDQVWPGVVRWDLGLGGQYGGEVLWRCDAVRAGKLYNRNMFGTREEAERFASQMREVEPDQLFNIEAIKASAVWN
jgi:hypothetical protein